MVREKYLAQKISPLMFFHVVHLDVQVLDIGETSDDALVVDAAVQWVAMRLLVGVLAIVGAVVVETCVLMQPVDGRVLGAVEGEHYHVVIHALGHSLGV